MNEPTFRDRTIKIHLVSIVSSITALIGMGFLAGQFYFDHDSRIARLEEFSGQGSRYTANDASRDFLLRDQRMDAMEEKFNSGIGDIKNTLDKMDKKLDLLFMPKQ